MSARREKPRVPIAVVVLRLLTYFGVCAGIVFCFYASDRNPDYLTIGIVLIVCALGCGVAAAIVDANHVRRTIAHDQVLKRVRQAEAKKLLDTRTAAEDAAARMLAEMEEAEKPPEKEGS